VAIDIEPLCTDFAAHGIGRYTRSVISSLLTQSIDLDLVKSADLQLHDMTRAWLRERELGRLVKEVAFNRNADVKSRCLEYGTAIAEFVEQNRDDVFHVTSPVTEDAVFPANSRIPLVSTMHDMIPVTMNYHPRVYSDEVYSDYLLKLTLMRRYSRRIVAVSNHTKNDLVSILEILPSRISTIYPSLELFIEDHSSADFGHIAHRLNLDKKYILYVGGLDPRKNVESLICAYAKLPKEIRDDHCLLLGAERPADMRGRVDEPMPSMEIQDNVIFAGYIPTDELALLYKRAELLVVPSYYEGFSFPIVEALHFGLPIAASNASSLPEVAGEAAVYFDPRNCNQMANAIRRLLTLKSERQRVIDAGRNRVRHFNETRAGQELVSTYDNLARPPRNPSGRRLRIAYVSPMPPAKTGIASYSRDLLPHLMKYFDIDAYCQETWATPNSNRPSLPLREYARLARDYNLTIYQMGNSPFHDAIYGLMMNHPGITFLHDNNLHDFIYHRALVRRKNPFSYEIELAAQYGTEGLRLARIVESAGLSSATACSKPLYFITALSSEMLVLTGDNVPNEFSNIWNVPVKSIPLGVETGAISSEAERERIRRDYDVPGKAFVILTAGFIEPLGLRDRRIDVCLNAFKKLVSKHEDCMYIVAGLTRQARQDLQELVKSLGLEDSVMMFEDSSEATFRALNQLSDLRLQLRYPCVSFTSGSILNSLALGKPVITSDVEEFEELPSSCVWKVKPEEPYETELLYRFLDRLFCDRELRSRMRQNAFDYCKQRSWEQIAKRIHDVVTELLNL
jgi:glycosyltransferase involved in cell wall biosynthesis